MFWRAAEAADPLEQRPPLGIGGERPGLVDGEDRVAGGVGGAEAQRVGGEQAQDREADALLLEQLGAGGAGERQGEVADPQAETTWAPPTSGGSASASPRPSRARPALAVDLERAADLAAPRGSPRRSSRREHLAAAAGAGGGGLGDRQAQLGLPLGLDRRRQDRGEEVVGEVLAGLGRRRSAAGRAGRGSARRPRARSSRSSPATPGSALEAVVALGVDVDDRARALQEGLPDRAARGRSSCPEPRLPASRQVGGRLRWQASARSNRTGEREPRQRVADVGADRRAGVADRVRHHRPELVGEQVLLVLGQRKGGGGQRGEEEAVLLAGGAVQLDAAVGLAQALDPLLELGLCARRRRESSSAERSSGGRSPPPRTPSSSRASAGARPPRARARARRLPPRGRSGRRRACAWRAGGGPRGWRRTRPRGSRRREAELERREHQLRGGAGDDRLLGQRAEHELGLVGAAALGVDRAASAGRP